MIAWAAILRIQQQDQYLAIGEIHGENYDLPIRAKWSLEDLYNDSEIVVVV
jgi:hypothetical protein